MVRQYYLVCFYQKVSLDYMPFLDPWQILLNFAPWIGRGIAWRDTELEPNMYKTLWLVFISKWLVEASNAHRKSFTLRQFHFRKYNITLSTTFSFHYRLSYEHCGVWNILSIMRPGLLRTTLSFFSQVSSLLSILWTLFFLCNCCQGMIRHLHEIFNYFM